MVSPPEAQNQVTPTQIITAKRLRKKMNNLRNYWEKNLEIAIL